MAIDDILKELYDRFCRDLAKSAVDMYYDESELLDIFAYASDYHDDYVCLEVLNLGARLYPNSDDLAKRKAFFLRSINPESFKRFFENTTIESKDTTWTILKYMAQPPASNSEAEKSLSEIIRLRIDDDDDAIQFIALVKQLHMDEWIYRNLKTIRKNCNVRSTLFFEIARLAETNDQIEHAIPLMEELTMEEPFNVKYWSMLSDLQAKIGKYNDALTSIEYAKSVDINDINMLGMEGHIYNLLGKHAEAIAPLEQAIAIDPTDDWLRNNLMLAYSGVGDTEKYAKIVVNDFNLFPYDKQLLIKYLSLYPENTFSALERFFAEEEPNEEAAVMIAAELCTNGNPRTAISVMEWYDKNYTLSQYGKFNLLEILYRNGEYETAYSLMLNDNDMRSIPTESLTVVGIMACVLLKSERATLAMQFCRRWIEVLKSSEGAEGMNPLIYRGVYETLNRIYKLLKKNSNPSPDEINRVVL